MEQSILILLKNQYTRLSEAEKKVADYLLAHSGQIPEMTIAEVAKEAGIAASGIVRMCKSLGFSGFAEVKRNLIRYAGSDASPLLPAVTPSDHVEEVLRKVFASSVRTLEDTLRMLNPSELEEVVSLLFQSKSIHFFGVGTSATIAQDAYYRFMRIGLPAFSEVDSHIMQIAAAGLHSGDTAVAISHCGATTDTLEALLTAKKHGASTIAITSTQDSPITHAADRSIVVYSDEIRYPMEAVSARIAHIAVLDALCVALSLKNPSRTAARTEEMHQLFATKRVGKERGYK